MATTIDPVVARMAKALRTKAPTYISIPHLEALGGGHLTDDRWRDLHRYLKPGWTLERKIVTNKGDSVRLLRPKRAKREQGVLPL